VTGQALGLATLAASAGLAVHLRRTTRERRSLRVIRELAAVTSLLPDARRQASEAARTLLRADAEMLLVPDDGELVTAVSSGLAIARMRVPIDDPVAVVARAFREQRTAFANHGGALDLPGLRELGARAVLAAPVTRTGIRLGVNLWVWRRPRLRLSLRERRLAGILGDEKGMGIQRAGMYAQAVDLMRMEVRTALARDLHDAVVQELALLRLFARSAAGAAGERPPVVDEVLPLIEEHSDAAYREMRALVAALRVGRTLTEVGIADMVDALVADFRGRCPDADVAVELPGGDGFEVHPEVREAVYFVLREALDGIERHAGTGAVHVRARVRADHVSLLVEAEGPERGPAIGFAEHGLEDMRERIRRAGGELEVSSDSGWGSAVRLRFEHPRTYAPAPRR
jgi:signal transduction histidine kinase